MSKVSLNLIEHFLVLFNKLKSSTRDEPSRIAVFYRQGSNLRTSLLDL